MSQERFVAGAEVKSGDFVVYVRRTWRERLLSWPWRPWIASKVVPHHIEIETLE